MTWFLIGVGHLNQAAMPRIIFCCSKQNILHSRQQLHFPACDTYVYNAAGRNQFKSFFSYYLIWIICWLALEADSICLYVKISELGKFYEYHLHIPTPGNILYKLPPYTEISLRGKKRFTICFPEIIPFLVLQRLIICMFAKILNYHNAHVYQRIKNFSRANAVP